MNFKWSRGALSMWLVVVVALLVVACNDEGTAPQARDTQTVAPTVTATAPTTTRTATVTVTPTGTATPTPEVRLSETCTNDHDGYRIDYPSGWHTNPERTTGPVSQEIGRCRYFDPQPFEVPGGTEFMRAISADIENVELERIREGLRGRGSNVLREERTTIAGREAYRIEAESTGEALLPAGTRSYRYLVAAGGGTSFAITTFDTEGYDYARNREIVDRMVETLEFLPAP